MSQAALRSAQNIKRSWWLVDAKDWRVGRLASHLTHVLMGKHKPFYVPSADAAGDTIVVVNADKVVFSGKKAEQKLYRWHTTYPGGLKEVSVKRWQKIHPTRILERAVSGMLPNNRLRRERMKRLKLIVGEEHPYRPQLSENPYKLDLSAPVREYDIDKDGFPQSGYVLTFEEDDTELKFTAEEVQSRKDIQRDAKLKVKLARSKALKRYVLGKGPRPDFLPLSKKQ